MYSKEQWKHIGQSVGYWFLYPITTNKVFFVFTLLMSLFVLILNNLIPGLGKLDVFLAILLPLFDGYLFCLIASLLKCVYLHWVAWLLFGAISLGEIFSILCYHSLYTINVLKLVFQTNGRETQEFLGSVIHTFSPWMSFGIVLIAVGLAWGIVWLGKRLQPKVQQVLLYLTAALVLWSMVRQVPQYICVGRCAQERTTVTLADSEHFPLLSSTSVRFLYGVTYNYVLAQELTALEQAIRERSEVNYVTYQCPTIVLVIGESYNKYHTPLYTPQALPTTPRLCQWQERKQLYVATDAVTPSNQTSNVMPHLFSTWDEQCKDEYIEHSVFPAIFKKAGYQVYYISNQFFLVSEDFWGMFGGSILSNPQISALQFDWRSPHCVELDEYLLQQVPPVDSLIMHPTLLIVHLLGQHVAYKDRYPIAFDRFQPDQLSETFGGKRGRVLRAQYANATLYNDSVVDALWKMFEHQDVIGIYLSDHGEEVFDYRNFNERSDVDDITPEIAQYQYEIPLMYWVSNTFQERHPQVVEAIDQSLDRPIISTDLCHTLFGLAGIATEQYQPSKDWLSPNYDSTRVRIIGKGTNYDTLRARI